MNPFGLSLSKPALREAPFDKLKANGKNHAAEG
jgi:hypothetical protein